MRTIISVQGLRAVAALAVVLCHFDILRVWLEGSNGPFPLVQLACGVDLFFVISGFIMVYSSEDLFAAKRGAITFFTRRIARIVPPYWVATAIAIPLMSLPWDWSSLISSYLFIPQYRASGGNIMPLYGVGWTLNFEMYFYALFSIAIFLRRDFAVILVCVTLCTIVLLGQWLQPITAPLQFWSDPIILEFALGMILALLYGRGIQLPIPIRILVVVVGIATIAFFDTRAPPTGYRVMQWGIPAALIFAGTVLGREINFGRLSAPVMLLGNSSYALYLAHSLMGAAVYIGWPHWLSRFPKMLVLVLAFVGVQLISIAVYYVFERRSSRFLQRILLSHRDVAGGVTESGTR